jgi:hypothetical protein
MQSKNGIQIDVLNANTPNRIPLNMLLEGGLTLVRMPHGPFKVRVITPHPSDVIVTLDANQLTTCQVPAGTTELAMGKDGRAFVFKAADATANGAPASATPIETEGFEPEVDPALLAQTVLDGVVGGEEALKQITQPPHVTGFLLVSVRFTEQAPIPGIVPPPYDTDEIAFQMNPPAEHNGMVAANFHKIVPPEKIERRWCSCCRRLDDR